jgi:uncharacterized membrane protein (UPF0127 family)
MAHRLVALVVLAGALAACSAAAEPVPTLGEPTTITVATTDAPEPTEAEPLPTLGDLASATITIDGREMVVAVADTADKRRRGLMNVTGLGGFDGMLFVWEADTGAAFWMQDTLIPLDIAFFGVGGSLVDRLRMEPCTTDECPLYSAAGLYRYAVEAPAGDLDFMTPESVLVLDGGG